MNYEPRKSVIIYLVKRPNGHNGVPLGILYERPNGHNGVPLGILCERPNGHDGMPLGILCERPNGHDGMPLGMISEVPGKRECTMGKRTSDVRLCCMKHSAAEVEQFLARYLLNIMYEEVKKLWLPSAAVRAYVSSAGFGGSFRVNIREEIYR